MRQADIFLESEGDAWLERNRDKLGARDPVAEAIEHLGIKPQRVLEVGCANGWRLAALRDKYGCEVYGIEPSRRAGIEAAAMRVPVLQSSAAVLPVTGQFDVVVYGFVLYLCDPDEWLRIAAEANYVLQDFGYIIIHDFFAGTDLFARHYKHRDGIMSYHFDFAQLWLAHPWYRLVRRTIINKDEMVIVLKKQPVCEVRP